MIDSHRDAYGKIDFKVRLMFNQLLMLWFVQAILSNNVLCHIDVENLETECDEGLLDAGNCSALLARAHASNVCLSTLWTKTSLCGLTLLTVFGLLWQLLILSSKVTHATHEAHAFTQEL